MGSLSPGFAVIGDSHIVADDDRAKRVNMYDSLYALQQVVDYCLAERLSLVIAGDLFDKNLVQSRLLQQVCEIMEPLKAAEIPVWGIQGNHDKDPTYPWFGHVDGALRLGLKPVEIGGYRVCGVDFAPAAYISQMLAKVEPCDCLVLHQALRQGLGFDGAWNCDLDWVDSAVVKDVWAGDLHKVSQELWSTDKQVRAVYTMSQYQTKVDESATPSFLRVRPKVEGQEHATYDRIPLQHRPIHFFTLEDEDDLNDLIDQVPDLLLDDMDHLPEPIRKPGFVVTYYADIAGVVEVLNELTENGQLGVIVEKALPARNSAAVVRAITSEAKEGLTLEAMAAERLEDDTEFKGFMMDLVRSKSPDEIKTVLGSWRSRVFKEGEHAA